MLLLDVNVLIRAHRSDLVDHAEVKQWLDGLIASGTTFGFPDGILASFVRIVTQAPFDPVTPIAEALDFASRLRSVPSCRVLSADAVQWAAYESVCRRIGAHGRAAQDVYWASFALTHDAEWLTFDRGFSRVPGLRWRGPLEPRARTNPR